tara:strand:- start:26 stop:415 length:390 start_codon:yes stop_codon:yes gene_type:complete
MKLKFEENGIVSGFPHHDGMFSYIKFVGKNEIELEVVSIGKVRSTLVINGVKLLSLNNLKEANIIDGFYWSKFSELSQSLIEMLPSRFEFSSLSEFQKEYANSFLIEMACSYGAEMFILVDNLSDIKLK